MTPENSLQRYKLGNKIGTGGMASVFLAFDTVLGRDVAIKMVHPHLLQHTETLRRFSNEAQAIASLSHDNIVRIYDYGQNESQPFIVMEFIDGCTLESLLAQVQRLPSLVAIEIALQVLSGLICAHQKGIYHRDIKPGNLLIDRSGRLRISDFGIAHLVNSESVTLTGSFLGSPQFVSPEQVSNRKISATTDIFSLGVLLYRCLTGIFPFDAETPHGTINAILSSNPAAPAAVNRQMILWLSDFVETFLVKDPQRRPSSADAFVRLEAACRTDGLHSGKERLSTFIINPLPAQSNELQELFSHYSKRAHAAYRQHQQPSALRLYDQAGRFGILDTADVGVVARISRRFALRRIFIFITAIAIGLVFAVILYRFISGSVGHTIEPERRSSRQSVTKIPVVMPSDTDNGSRTARILRDSVKNNPHNPTGAQRKTTPVTASGEVVTVTVPTKVPMHHPSSVPTITTGFFTCFTNPPWVTIFIDGIDRGTTPIQSAIPLSSGKHHLLLKRQMFADYSDTVNIVTAETTQVRIKLEQQQE